MQAVGQRGEALHMAQSQQAAEEAVQGGLVLPLLLELLSQLEEALPPPVQHPQSQPETSEPPIRAPPAQDKSSSLLLLWTQAPQVERGSLQPVRELPDEGSEPASTHTHQQRRFPPEEGGEWQSFRPGKSRTGGEKQAEAAPSSGAQTRSIPPPHPSSSSSHRRPSLLSPRWLHQERRAEEVGEYPQCEWQSRRPISALLCSPAPAPPLCCAQCSRSSLRSWRRRRIVKLEMIVKAQRLLPLLVYIHNQGWGVANYLLRC